MNKYESGDPSVGSWRDTLQGRIGNLEKHRYTYPSTPSVDTSAGVASPDYDERAAFPTADEVRATLGMPLTPAVDRDFEEAVDSILAELRATMLKKQADYGPKNISQSPGGPLNGLRVRMFDKLARISNLHESGVEPENESIQDSFLDIGNYGIIGLMVLRGQWPGTER